MRLPPPAMRWPASSGISGISDCMRARLTALTRLRSPATSWTIGSCDGLREPTRRWIVARISLAMWRQSRAKASQTGLAWRVIAPQRGRITTKEARVTDETLRGFRQSIDNIDAALIHMLAERFRVTPAVGRYKATAGLPPADPGREDRQIARLRRLPEDAQLDPEFSEKFLRFIIDEVTRHHEHLRDTEGGVAPPA